MAAARPKLTCDEEELLKMQEDFRTSRIKNSVSEVFPTVQSNSNSSSEGKKSIFAQRREKADKEKANTVHFEFPKVQVLKDVVEKCEFPQINVPVCPGEKSFPEVFQRKKSHQNSGCGSIFSQQFKKAKVEKEIVDKKSSVTIPAHLGQCSTIAKAVLGETEATKVHQENLQKLASMNKEDILREQQQLLQKLDPKLIAFLKQKKMASSNSKALESNSPKQTQEKPPTTEPEILEIKELANPTWVHMDKIEKEKVRWMSSLPPIKEISGQSFQARFDFHGHLLPATADLPVTTALYHHGEEPERAGYSVNELMLLSRSSKLQQRVVAINTLAKVLENARLGTYDSFFEAPLVPTLLDSGIMMLLRFCLDDSSPAVVTAALVAFSRLLSNPFDETCLERCYIWYNGEQHPDLCSRVEIDSADKEQEEEMKDNEMTQVDVIKACLRMDVLWRIRYILEEIRPEAKAVIAALEILTRMARHSLTVAQSIFDCPRLLDVIFRHFLPKDWTSLSLVRNQEVVDNVYGLPVRQVFRLARVMASWSADLALQLVTKHSLLESIKIYVAMDTAELNLPTQEALLLVLDSYHTWRTLIRQEIGIQAFMDFCPAWFPQLMYYQSSVSMDGIATGSSTNTRFSHQLGSSMFLMMEALLSTCCHSGNGQLLRVVELDGLREVVQICVAKWTWQLRNFTNPIPESAGSLLAAGIHFLATFFTYWIDPQADFLLDQLCLNHILPLLYSEPLNELSKSLIRYSNLSSSLQPCSRCPESLPSINATVMDGELVPVLASSTPFPLLTSIFRLLKIWKAKKTTTVQATKLKLDDSYFEYLANLSQSTSMLSSNWFTRYEINFLHYFFMTCAEWSTLTVNQSKVVHQAALTAISSLSTGDEAVAVEWIKHLIFQKDFVQRGVDLETDMERMHLTGASCDDLISKALSELNQVATFYNKQLFPEKMPESTSLILENRLILPSDWIYLPLVSMYQRDLEKPCGVGKHTPETALLSLQAVYILLLLRPAWFLRIKPAEHYARLACVFMAGNDLFLEESVIDYMWPILRTLAEQPLDLTRPVTGVDDFLDLYDRLADQYEAVSYGSPLFGAFLLLPLQQQQPVRFRMKLWCEHSTALRSLALDHQQMLAPLDRWLEPIETEEVLLMKYAASVRLGQITSQRNSVIYQIATHHIQHYLERNPLARDKLYL